MSPELAAIEVIGCETDEGGDLLAVHLAELRQQGDEGEGEHWTDAWHRGQAGVALRESRLRGDHLGETLVEEMDIGLKPGEAAFSETLQHGVFEVAGLVLEADVLIGKLPPHGDDLGDPAGGRVVADGVRGAPSSFAALSP